MCWGRRPRSAPVTPQLPPTPAQKHSDSRPAPIVQVNVRLTAPEFMEHPSLALLLCRLWRAAAAPAAGAAASAGLSLDFTNISDGGAQGDPGELCPAQGIALHFEGWSGALPEFTGDVFDALPALCGRLDAAGSAADVRDATLAATGYSPGGVPGVGAAAGGDVGRQEAAADGAAAWELGQQCVRQEQGALAAEVCPCCVLCARCA